MVKLSDIGRLPVLVVMALQTVLAEAPFVLILVASHTGWRNSEEAAAEILIFDRCALLCRDVGRRVTLVASHSCMFAL